MRVGIWAPGGGAPILDDPLARGPRLAIWDWARDLRRVSEVKDAIPRGEGPKSAGRAAIEGAGPIWTHAAANGPQAGPNRPSRSAEGNRRRWVRRHHESPVGVHPAARKMCSNRAEPRGGALWSAAGVGAATVWNTWVHPGRMVKDAIFWGRPQIRAVSLLWGAGPKMAQS